MLVFNDNYQEIFPIFKETVDSADFVSFDCEMTGVTLESKTDGTKYDIQQFRYIKQKEVVEKFNLIQIGFTFYIKKSKEVEIENIQKIDDFYIERTFTFYLFKNSKLRFLNKNIFSSEMMCNPASLKFLNENHFDLNILVSKGITYNKLEYKDEISKTLKNEKFLFSNNAMFLSKVNENNIIEKIIDITEFLLKDHSENKNKKKDSMIVTLNSKQTMLYLLGINLKKLLSLNNFTVSKYNGEKKIKENKKDKNKNEEVEEKIQIPPNSLIIEKTKRNLIKEEFETKFTSFDNFKLIIKNDPTLIYQSRFQISTQPSDEIIETLTNNELGFSQFIQLIINKKLPIIGHNIYFDMMFIYDKLIGDLPEKFYSFKKKIHNYFPKIYDTKAIGMLLKKFEKTKLDDLYKILMKRNYNNYIKFYADVKNGFAIYNDFENNKLHDAGYDSIITGRCFVLMCKAFENNFEIENQKAITHKVGNKTIAEEKQIKIKFGFVNLDVFNKYLNISLMSIVDSDYAKINWDTDFENEEKFLENENKLINETFISVFHVKFNKEKFAHIINIYEIARIFENDDFNITVVKTDYFSAFVEFETDNYENDKDNILKVIDEIKKNDKIDNIIYGKDFYKDYLKEINF